MTNNIYFIANWKMYGSTSTLSSLNKLINLSKQKKYNKAKIIYFPPFTLIYNFMNKFKKTKISQTDRDALQVMELNDEVKWEQIHLKFKELVKKYHPDKNQGSKKFEDKLKKITLAYSQLKKTLGKK